MFDRAQKLLDHVICETCRLKIHMDKVLVAPDELRDTVNNLLLWCGELADWLGSSGSAYPVSLCLCRDNLFIYLFKHRAHNISKVHYRAANLL